MLITPSSHACTPAAGLLHQKCWRYPKTLTPMCNKISAEVSAPVAVPIGVRKSRTAVSATCDSHAIGAPPRRAPMLRSIAAHRRASTSSIYRFEISSSRYANITVGRPARTVCTGHDAALGEEAVSVSEPPITAPRTVVSRRKFDKKSNISLRRAPYSFSAAATQSSSLSASVIFEAISKAPLHGSANLNNSLMPLVPVGVDRRWSSVFTGSAFDENNGDRGSGGTWTGSPMGEQPGRCESLSGNTTAARPCCLRMVKMCWKKLSCNPGAARTCSCSPRNPGGFPRACFLRRHTPPLDSRAVVGFCSTHGGNCPPKTEARNCNTAERLSPSKVTSQDLSASRFSAPRSTCAVW
jgi:hypothetical protein